MNRAKEGKAINTYIENMFSPIINSHRLPQSVIIEGESEEKREECAKYLCAYAVCKSEKKPCLSCNACKKAFDDIHPDIIIPKPEGKTKIIPVKLLRDKYLPQAYLKPTEADIKIVIFNNADSILKDDTENTLLKIIEEPHSNLLFIFTCEKAHLLLQTIRSRSQIYKIPNENETSDISDTARNIAHGIVALYEDRLLVELSTLSQRDKFKSVMYDVSEILMKALSVSCGQKCDDETANELATKLTKLKLLALIDATKDAVEKCERNINLKLLSTYVCTQYRRISWQR